MIGAVALAALCALAGCGSNHPPEAVAMPALHPKTQLATLAYGRSAPVIGGERLHAELLQRFYARHGFEPVWTTRQAQANALVDAVLRAGDQGLDPELFHATLLQHRAALPPIDRELLLSDAFLSYADALARGAVPVERRRDDETLAPEPINVAAVLDDAIDSRDPASVIEALAPTTPTYQALRQALQKYRPAALAGDKAAIDRVRMIEVNLERQRWLPRPLPPDRAWVNIADERLVLYRDDQPVFSSRVVVGQDSRHNQSPEFRATIDASFFNPPWVVPRDIVIAEILPKISSDPDYLTRNRMVMLASGEVEQLPSPEAGLGLVMFDMPNRFDVYLHDTPDRQIFNRDNRRISHGCIRVQNPLQFAALLLRQPIGSVNQGIAQGIAKASTTRHELPKPVPVFVVYQTAFADTDGTLQFRPDFYSRDAAIWQQLHKPGSEPVAPVTKHPVSLASASSGSAPSGSAPLGSVKPKSPAKKAGYVRRLTKS
ncbi:MAG TPA: L,D-transpeptidase family protein [Rhodopila sp.]|nr:L,D-transpeptidase family protein [Rhodopila sp.]